MEDSKEPQDIQVILEISKIHMTISLCHKGVKIIIISRGIPGVRALVKISGLTEELLQISMVISIKGMVQNS